MFSSGKCFDNKVFCDFNYPWPSAVAIHTTRIFVTLKTRKNMLTMLLFLFFDTISINGLLFCHFFLFVLLVVKVVSWGIRPCHLCHIFCLYHLPVCNSHPSIQLCIDMYEVSCSNHCACYSQDCKSL